MWQYGDPSILALIGKLNLAGCWEQETACFFGQSHQSGQSPFISSVVRSIFLQVYARNPTFSRATASSPCFVCLGSLEQQVAKLKGLQSWGKTAQRHDRVKFVIGKWTRPYRTEFVYTQHDRVGFVIGKWTRPCRTVFVYTRHDRVRI